MASDLLELVKARRQELGLSYQSLAAVCVDPSTGAKALSSWLHRLETNRPVVPPSVEVLGAMAVGLQLPRARLQEAAAAQFFGVHISWEMSGEAADLLAQLALLPAGQRQAAVDLLARLAVLPEGQRQAVSNLIRVMAEGEPGRPSK